MKRHKSTKPFILLGVALLLILLIAARYSNASTAPESPVQKISESTPQPEVTPHYMEAKIEVTVPVTHFVEHPAITEEPEEIEPIAPPVTMVMNDPISPIQTEQPAEPVIIEVPKEPEVEEPVIEPEESEKVDQPEEEEKIVSSAVFTATHYCGCSSCCGQYSSGSESVAYGCRGDLLTPYVSIAADPNILPYGTVCWDDAGNTYIVQDVGGGINSYRIDIFVGNHYEALCCGIKNITLYWGV